MLHLRRFLPLAVVMAPLCGCAAASFDAAGYKHPDYTLTVPYADRQAHVFISPDWRVDNFALDRTGAPAPTHTYWKGFKRGTAVGLVLEHRAPTTARPQP